jgi:hypothetical protein
MRRYERLSEEDRNSRRTMADAVEVLREKAGFGNNDRAEISIGRLKLPSAEVVGLVQIIFDPRRSDEACVVSLPTSKQFKAYRANARERDCFDIAELHGAVLDGSGNVLLTNDTALRAVEVIPARLPLEPTEFDWRIIHCTLSIIGAEHCYRYLSYGLPPQLRERVPDLRILDCSTFESLTLPRLKVLISRIRETEPPLPSAQQVADTLHKFGIRIPIARPRRRHGLTTM